MNAILRTIGLAIFTIGFFAPALTAQEQVDRLDELTEKVEYLKPGTSRFLLRGYAHSGLEYHQDDDELTFVGGSFNPLFIYRQSEKLLFESELDMGFEEDGAFDIGLEYANISYLLTKTLNIRVGKLFVPFGIFVERLHPAWINKLPTAPLGYGHDGILPGTDIGIELRGGAYAGNLKYNYAFYVVNGPQFNDGEEEEDEAGKIEYGKIPDNNKNKAFGGRIGILPFSNSSLEVGFSGMFAKTGARDSEYEDISSQLYAVDLTYVKSIPAIKSVVDIKAQANLVNNDDADFIDPEDTTGVATYTFDNSSSAYFAQLSIRPSFVNSPVLRNLELVGRYSSIDTPEGSLWEANDDKWDFGLNYWVNWRTVVKVSFSSGKLTGEAEDEEGVEGIDEPSRQNAFFLHWAIGF